MNEGVESVADAGDAIEHAKLRIAEQRLEIEQARLALEQSFWRKKAGPLLGILAAIVAGIFTLSQVGVAWIQKDKEVKLAHERNLFVIKTEQMRKFALAYQLGANAVNSWCVHVLELAEQETKSARERDAAAISHARAEIPKLQEEFRKAIPVESELTVVAALFASPEVRETAKKMRVDWLQFEALLHTTNQRHRKGDLRIEDINGIKKQRGDVIASLERRKDDLLSQMATEVSAGAR